MITSQTIRSIKDHIRNYITPYGMPTLEHFDICNIVGQRLAEELHADKNIVMLGTILKDFMIGEAYKAKKLPAHIEMSAKEAIRILNTYPEITDKEKKSILSCIHQHHGAKTFDSLESEIVCNSDSYQFLTVYGFLEGFKHSTLQLDFNGLVKFYSDKVDEKWRNLSLDICKAELEPQYESIKKFLSYYEDPNQS